MVLMTSSAISWALQLWILFLPILLYGDFVSGQRNDSVPQDFAGIVYRGEWRMVNDSRSVGGRHRLAVGAGASAEYTFTGTAFYFMSAKWPYPVRSNVSLDGRAGILLDLQDHANPERPRNASATVGAAVIERGVWTNLTNGRHTVRVTVPIGDDIAVVDNFLVTIPGDSVVETSTSPTSTGTETTSASSTETATSISTETTPTPEPDPEETTTGDIEWETYTSTYTTIEDLSMETQTVVVVEVPLSTGTAGTSNSDGSSSSSSSGGTNRGLAIGFGVAFGVILLVLLIGIIFWIRKRDRLLQERDGGGTAVLPPPTREVGREAASDLGGSVRGPGYVAGLAAGSGTATPLPQNNMAGIGSGPLRDSMARRHSYDGTFLRPQTQPEPWAENFTPVARAV